METVFHVLKQNSDALNESVNSLLFPQMRFLEWNSVFIRRFPSLLKVLDSLLRRVAVSVSDVGFLIRNDPVTPEWIHCQEIVPAHNYAQGPKKSCVFGCECSPVMVIMMTVSLSPQLLSGAAV